MQRMTRADFDADGTTETDKLAITLVTDDNRRLNCLNDELCAAGLDARLDWNKPGHSTASRLRRMDPEKSDPGLILLDFTIDHLMSRRMLKSIAFGEKRSKMALAVLTMPETEAILDSGEVDGGEATMFSPTSVASLFAKLAGPDSQATLRSIGVLNQYGPVLLRACSDCEAFESAEDHDLL